MARIDYINEDGKIDWQKFALLTEDEQDEEQMNWTEDQIDEYFWRHGVMTLDEFIEELYKINREVYGTDESSNK